jgi:hypothetical protein
MFEGVTLMSFGLGAVVLPAVDGTLAEHGYSIKELGPMALGVVIEEGSRRSHVNFPDLKVSLWLEHLELRDVKDQMAVDPAFKVIEKFFKEPPSKMRNSILMNLLITNLHATHVLGIDHGKLEDVWEESADKLSQYYSGSAHVDVVRLSLGIEEFKPSEWETFKNEIGDRIVLARFLPSGMHKLEMSIYFKRL